MDDFSVVGDEGDGAGHFVLVDELLHALGDGDEGVGSLGGGGGGNDGEQQGDGRQCGEGKRRGARLTNDVHKFDL